MDTDTNKPISQNRDQVSEELTRQLFNFSAMAEREMLGRRLGTQFEGDRDLYKTFGYVFSPGYQDYRNLYNRQGISTRIVEKFAQDTWAKPPALIDGEARSDKDDETQTPFIKEWNALTKRLSVWRTFRQADIMLGFSRYSVIFLGAPGKFSDPAGKGTLSYIMPYDEQAAQIGEWIRDTTDPKFALPKIYNITFNDPDSGMAFEGGGGVHHTRIIHIAENKLSSRTHGRPRLQNLINRLMDLEKVTGGGAEAVWLSLIKGFILTSKDGAGMPEPGTEEERKLNEAIQKFYNRMQRYAVIENVDVHDLGNASPSVRDTFDVLIEDICGSVGISQRILLGSERGELASEQDKKEWNQVITDRRTNFAEPEIVRPFVDWCILHKVIPPPNSGDYKLGWEDVYPMTLTERVDYANKLAMGASTVTGGMIELALDVNEWRTQAGLAPKDPKEIERQEKELQAEEEKRLKDAQKIQGSGKPGGFPTGKKPAAKVNAFPDHEGRPGLRGGSLPRGAGADMGLDKGDIIDLAQKFGYPTNKVIALQTRGPMFNLDGQEFETAGEYYPETREIVLYKGATKDEDTAGAVLAHEVQHDRFNTFKRQLELENSIISASIHNADKKDWFINADGSLNLDNPHVDPDSFQAYTTNERYLTGKNLEKMIRTDGITPYSKAHWNNYKDGKTSLDLPVNETLAEIARVMHNRGTGNTIGIDKDWIGLYRSVNRISAQ